MRALVLGHRGMLGHIVCDFLQNQHVEVTTVKNRWPTPEFKVDILTTGCDYIVNCIGSIPQRKNDFKVNRELPIWLDQNALAKVIHPGTDCELDDDEYGTSKKEASLYLIENGARTKIIQTSIIGPELHTTAGLFEWFMNSTGEVAGWTGNLWNGNTTLQWAKICYDMMMDWQSYEVLTVPVTECISKFEILNLIKEVFEKEIGVVPMDAGNVDKCLIGTVSPASLGDQLLELKTFMENR